MRYGHRWLIGVLVVALAALVLIAPGKEGALAQGDTIYVDADADGANNGDSWMDAYTDLQLALDEAGEEDQIWVAAGTYKPTAEHGGSGDRYRSFQMENGVAIYGGFDPSVGDTEWEDRDWVAHLTILSGDIGIGGDRSDNSYHVFYHSEEYIDLDSSAILDGFAISGGNANGTSWNEYRGGGMYNDNSSPTLTNCTFSDNSAGVWVGPTGGGGMYNHGSSPVLTNCTFSGNWTYGLSSGGGMLNEDSSPVLNSCTFEDNHAYDWGFGGGMVNRGSSPTLTACTFKSNSTTWMGHGGGMDNWESSPTLRNCTFLGNSAGYGGGMYNSASDPDHSSSPLLTNCTFSDNSAEEDGGGMGNANSSPTLTNCILWGDTPDEIGNDLDSSPVVTYSDIQGGYPGEGNIDAYPWFVDPANGDLHLGACSRCIDAGDPDPEGLPPYDFEGDDRIIDGDEDGEAIVDMGVDEVAVVGTCFRVYLPVVLRGY
jgi:hypothetical protein